MRGDLVGMRRASSAGLAASPAILVPVPVRSYFLYAVKTPHRKNGTLKYHRFSPQGKYSQWPGRRGHAAIRRSDAR
jgi:hypothetical protein